MPAIPLATSTIFSGPLEQVPRYFKRKPIRDLKLVQFLQEIKYQVQQMQQEILSIVEKAQQTSFLVEELRNDTLSWLGDTQSICERSNQQQFNCLQSMIYNVNEYVQDLSWINQKHWGAIKLYIDSSVRKTTKTDISAYPNYIISRKPMQTAVGNSEPLNSPNQQSERKSSQIDQDTQQLRKTLLSKTHSQQIVDQGNIYSAR